MKKIIKKTTTEEFSGGELVKRVIEETTEEVSETPDFSPITLPPSPSPWCGKTIKIGDGISSVLLSSSK